MANDKPLISILMAVYEPNMEWLREQLVSLNSQTYPNLRLYIRDDCSPTTLFNEVEQAAKECVTKFPFTIKKNTENLGSNGTFELLTREAEGDYLAYCDQDDIWSPEKLTTLYELITCENGAVAYSDMSVIDEFGKTVANSLKEIRPRLQYVSGENLKETFFFRNCAAGCALLIPAKIAKKAMPFPKKTVHDQWLCIIAAGSGKVCFCGRPLVKYRQHGKNQTGILTNVVDKRSYYDVRLEPLNERLAMYEKYFGNSKTLSSFVFARLNGKVLSIWHYRRFSSLEAKFEIMMKFMPEQLFKKILGDISESTCNGR